MAKNQLFELGKKHVNIRGNDRLVRLVENYNAIDNCYCYEVQLFNSEEKKFLPLKPFAFKQAAEGFFNHLS
jgi:hypothetical protein